MRQIETDYLVVGAGASGMAFVDALIGANRNADVVIVDRQHRPGGHWLNAYPFVRIHQTSVNYGVNSRKLSEEKIDTTGPNAGFYPRARASEITEYYTTVLERDLLPSGQVRFLPMTDYRGPDGDGHALVSNLSGERTQVKVRKALVDATYVESSIPSKHTPSFEVDPDVTFIPPNDLVDLAGPADRYTIVGGGKTSMDTCVWLMEQGVAPDRIRWIRPRDGWWMDRAAMQPLDLVGAYMLMQGKWVRAAAEAESGQDFALRMEDAGVFVRLDRDVLPTMFRGAIMSTAEAEALRQVENVVRGRVRRITTAGVDLATGSIDGLPGEVYIDCTAAGVPSTVTRPIFEPGLITLQYVTIGIVPWGAAVVGAVEGMRDDVDEKNALCPPLEFTGRIDDVLELAYAGMTGLANRGAQPDINEWSDASRLNPARGVADHLDDPRVSEAFGVIVGNFGAAMENLERRVTERSPSAV